MKNISYCIAILFTLTQLAACSGGNSSDGSGGEVKVSEEQVVFFLETSPLKVVVGDELKPSVVFQGTGSVSFESSNDSIVTIDSAGLLTASAPGSVTITVSIEADEKYLAASATYEVNVVSNNFTINAWVGKADSQFIFSAEADGFDFYRSNEPNCNIINYAACENGQFDLLSYSLNTGTVSDTSLTLTSDSYSTFKFGNNEFPQDISLFNFGSRQGHQLVNFNGRIWMIAGDCRDFSLGLDERLKNDIWSSADGINWREETASAEFSGRKNHQVIIFNEKLWLIGGYGENGQLSDVWSSDDGIHWVEKTSMAEFGDRYNYKVVIFDNKFWLIGGSDQNGYLNDAWTSEDGSSWGQVSTGLDFSPRRYSNLVSFNNKLWLYAGFDDTTGLDDIWSSENGLHWTQESTENGFEDRSVSSEKIFEFDKKLYAVTKYYSDDKNTGYFNEIWSSDDGLNWVRIEDNPAFGGRNDYQVTVFNNKMLLSAGSDSEKVLDFSDVWTSPDGKSWTELSTAAEYAAQLPAQAVSFKEGIWLSTHRNTHKTHGSDNGGVWLSADGFSWIEHKMPDTYADRGYHQMVEFNDKLFISGGYSQKNYTALNDVWSSMDGKSWVVEAETTDFLPRQSHQMIEFNGELWVVGGESRHGTFGDVWRSSDGINWTEEVSLNPKFSPRLGHQLVHFKGKIWLIGGKYNSDYYNDVWVSDDGIDWEEVVITNGFSPRASHELAVFNDKLWLFAGTSGSEKLNDIWSSDDGISWVQEKETADFPKSSFAQVIEHDNKLFMLGANFDDVDQRNNKVWSSDNGIDWRLGYKAEITLK